jgi:argininosuccinate synthase
MTRRRIVFAYSGGLEAGIAIPWLREHYDGDVVALSLDLGQPRELEEVRDRALASGAVRAHVLDAREEFARDFVLPSLQAGALVDGRDPLAAALAEPLVARKLVDVARIEQTRTVAHGAVDGAAVRLDEALHALDRTIEVLAPGRDAGIGRRGDAATGAFRIGSNLWGRSIIADDADTWAAVPDGVYALTKSAHDAPNAPAFVDLSFEHGVPVAINGIAMSLTELIESLSIIAGQHGVGRIDLVEDIRSGKRRHVYEAPAAVVLHAALRDLETAAVPRELTLLARELGSRYAQLIADGQWHSPVRDALDAFFGRVQQNVTGMVRVKLFKGQHAIAGRTTAAASAAGAFS